jgi:hypothetical protein
LLKSTRDALYLSGFSTRLLPYLMALNTMTTAMVAAGYLRLYKHFSLRKTVAFSFLFYLAGTLGFWYWTSHELRSAMIPYYLWAGVYFTLAPVQTWSVISSRLFVRQARRSLGLIGGGAIVGGIAGGLFAQFFAGIWNVQSLLPIASFFIFLALLSGYLMSTTTEIAEETGISDDKTTVRRRLVLLLMVVVGALTIVSTFADFQFKVISQQKIGSAKSLAIFFGAFYANLGVITLIFQVFATPALMRRMGLKVTLSVLPFALLTGNIFLLAARSIWSAIFLKGSEQLFRFSLDRSSMEVIYLAIPEKQRVRIKALVDTVGNRLFEALASGILIVLFTLAHYPLWVIAVLSIVFCCIAIVAIVLLGMEYKTRLQSSVGRKELSAANFESDAFSTTFYNLLPDLLKGSSKEMILDLLDLLEADQKGSHYLKALLAHSDPEIRFRTLQVLNKRKEDFSQKVEPLISDPDSVVRLEAIHYLLVHSPMGYLNQIVGLVQDPAPAVRIAANAAAMNHENPEIRKKAYEWLKSLPNRESNASELDVRLEMAHVLGFIRHSPASNELYKRLLNDPSLEVQRAALQSIARSTPAGLVSTLIEVAPNSPLLEQYQETLASFGQSLLPQLKRIMEDKKKSRDQKKLILNIADTVGGKQASEILAVTALGPDLPLRFAAIKGMNRLKDRRSLEVADETLESLLGQEMQSLKLEWERFQLIQPQPGSLMDRVLRQRRQWTRERIFRVLGLLYDPKTIYHAYLAFTSLDRRKEESALELLDTILRSEHRNKILSLIENPNEIIEVEASPESRRAVLMSYIGARDQLPAAAFISQLKNEELRNLAPEIESALKVFPGLSLIEDILEWRLSEMDPTQPVAKKSKSLSALHKMENLGKIDIFSKLGPHELLALAKGSDEVTFEPDQIVFSEGEDPHHIYMLVRGKVQRYRISGPVDEIYPGESFGALAVLSKRPHLYSARAVERSYCFQLEQEILLDVMEDFPALSIGIFESLAQRIQGLMTRVDELEGKLDRLKKT